MLTDAEARARGSFCLENEAHCLSGALTARQIWCFNKLERNELASCAGDHWNSTNGEAAEAAEAAAEAEAAVAAAAADC